MGKKYTKAEAAGKTSQSRFARQLPYEGEPLARRESVAVRLASPL